MVFLNTQTFEHNLSRNEKLALEKAIRFYIGENIDSDEAIEIYTPLLTLLQEEENIKTIEFNQVPLFQVAALAYKNDVYSSKFVLSDGKDEAVVMAKVDTTLLANLDTAIEKLYKLVKK